MSSYDKIGTYTTELLLEIYITHTPTRFFQRQTFLTCYSSYVCMNHRERYIVPLAIGTHELGVSIRGFSAQTVMNMDGRPTALYCENDMIAIAMLKAFRQRGVRVPEDIALIGHDGLDLCGMVLPTITTVAQPRYEMGRAAAQLLIEQIEGDSPPRRILLKPDLRVGETA